MKLASLALAALLALPLPASAASVADWRADIDAIVRQVELVHPNPFAKTGKLTFLRRAEALKAQLPSLSEEQRMAGAMRLVALVGDGHTWLEPDTPAFAWWYPVRVYAFSDGYFITGAYSTVKDLAGAQVLEIGGRPVDQVAEAARDLLGADNAFGRRENLFVLSDAALMKGLGFTDPAGGLKLKVRLASGRVAERTLPPMRPGNPRFAKDDATFEWRFLPEMTGPPIGDYPGWTGAWRGLSYDRFRTTDPDRPLRLMQRRFFAARAVPDKDAYYIQVNFVGDSPDQSLLAFFRDALAEVDRQRPRRLIVDIRYNFGGDGSKLPAVIAEFIKRRDAPPWKELYLVTGRRTFSAGVMMAGAFLDDTDATVVGEPAGAALNHNGDNTPLELKRIGASLTVSTVWHQLSSSTDLSETTPLDVPAPMSFADYAAGRDPAADPILAGEEMRSLQAIAMADGGAAARKAYEARKARFGSLPWWEAARGDPMTHAGYALSDAGRGEDALEVFRLDAEIHPGGWRAWNNLGEMELKLGRKEQGMAHYRQALELNPGDDEAREALAKAGAG